VTRHILILGDNLAGLITAYRLVHYGFHISLMDVPVQAQPTGHLGSAQQTVSTASSPLTSPVSERGAIPLILHGFYHATWALLQELSFEWPPQTSQPVAVEFAPKGKTPIAFPKPSRIPWLHPLIRLTFFKGLTWSDRWHVLNFLERQWEHNLLTNPHPDIENVETWLRSAKQSEHSRTHFWNPLCRFFLNSDLSHASLSSFTHILSQYWFGQPSDAATFLAPPETLPQLEATLRQRLITKGVRFHSARSSLRIHIEEETIQAIEQDEQLLQAHAYVSALTPRELLPWLPERALTRYGYFSHLSQIPERDGLAIRFTLHDTLIPPRLILTSNPFDWITSQPHSNADSPKTVITAFTLRQTMTQTCPEEELMHTAWALIQKTFNLSPAYTAASCEPHLIQPIGPFSPCQQGSRTYRPLPQTPFANFFLTGPWTTTNLPTSLESTIRGANACAEAITTAIYGTLD
jgi:hypothetical protein